MQSDLERELANQMEYVVCCISHFAKRFNLKNYQVYPYLKRSGGIEYLLKDKALCTRPQSDVLNDLNGICKVSREELEELQLEEQKIKSPQEINMYEDEREQREFVSQVNGLITDVLLLLITDDGLTPLQALDYFYLSRTCKALERPETCLYYESPVYVWDFLHREKALIP